MQTVKTTLLFLICVILLGACGNKGRLYLPGEEPGSEPAIEQESESGDSEKNNKKDPDKDKEKEFAAR